MENKDFTTLTNSEIFNYKISLENKFNTIKEQITNLCMQLEELDAEYNEVEEELRRRQNIN